MLRLILFRHAKSDWGSPGVEDIDRPLNPRGREAAPLMAAWLREQGLAPDRTIVSSARRTRETWALAYPELRAKPSVSFERRVYEAKPEALADVLREETDAATVLLLGHNPGMQRLALDLAWPDPTPERRSLAEKFPTAAIAVLELDIDDWAALQPDIGKIAHFVTPKGVGAAAEDD